MTSKIFRSISIVVFIVLLSSISLILGILYNYYSTLQVQELETKTQIVEKAVEIGGINYLNSLDEQTYRITWIDDKGNVLFDNKVTSDNMENHLEREEVKDALTNGKGSSSRYSTTLMEKLHYHALRLSDGSVIRLSVSQVTWWGLLLSMIQPILIVFVLAIGLSFILAYRLSRKIVEPLNKIDLDNPESISVYEELNPLIKRISYQQKEIKLKQKELEQKQNEFIASTENMTEGIVLLNPDGMILSINKSASKILGITSYCVGKDLLLFNASTEIKKLLNSAIDGNHSEVIIPIDKKNYEFNASPVIADEKVTGVALIIFDITEKEKLEVLRKEFTANVSHELRTPLQTIAGGAELLANGLVKNEDVKTFSSRIYKESKRLITLVEDIIKLSHLDEGITGEIVEENNLYDIAKQVSKQLSSACSDANVKMTIEGENAIVVANKQLVYSIVYNLCDNSIKYNKKDGKVEVKVNNLDKVVRLSVSDTGIGIPLEDQERIFERFYRVDKSHSKEVGGTGLGLSIVKHACKILNAKIDIKSIIDEGTEIIISFPKDIK